MSQKGRVNSGEAEGKRFAVHADRSILQWADKIISRIHQLEEIGSVIETERPFCNGNECFDWSVARSGAHTGKGAIHPHGTLLDRSERICNAQGEVFMGVDADLRFGLQRMAKGPDPLCRVADEQGPCRVGDVDAMCPIRTPSV